MEDQHVVRLVLRILAMLLIFIVMLTALDFSHTYLMARRELCFNRTEIMNTPPMWSWSKCK